jgi:hypothetical protein
MGGKLAVLTLAFLLSNLGLEAQDDYGVSFDDYTYTGSNGCSSFGACDRNWSTVTDSSALQSSGWQYSGNSWQVAFTPGQLQLLSPSFADQMNSIQTRIQQAYQNALSGVQEAVNRENARDAGEFAGHAIPEAALDHFVDPFAGLGFSFGMMGIKMAPQVGTQYSQPTIFDPALDFPLSAQIGSASPSFISGDSGPFTTVDPDSATIVDPPFTGDPSTIIDLNSRVGQGGAMIVDPPFTGDPSTVIDLNPDAEAQQMLLQAKHSQQSLVSEQQQLQSQASQYQGQSEQTLNYSTTIFQSASDRAFSNAVGNISGYRLQAGSTASTGNAWQSFVAALNGFSKIGQSMQPTRVTTVTATQPGVARPQGCTGPAETIGACQLIQNLVRSGVIPPGPGQSWMLNTPATQSTAPPLTLGPTGVTCQTDAKGRTTCTGTLPSWMH